MPSSRRVPHDDPLRCDHVFSPQSELIEDGWVRLLTTGVVLGLDVDVPSQDLKVMPLMMVPL